MVESEVAKDSSAGSSSVNIRSLLCNETPSLDSSGSLEGADFSLSRVTRDDGTTVYLLNDHVIEAQQLADLREIVSFKIATCQKWLDFTKMDIMKMEKMIELDNERLSKKMQQRENWQSLLDDARKLMQQLQNLRQVSDEASEIRDTREETVEQSGMIEVADQSVKKTAVPSVCVTDTTSVLPQRLLQANFEDGWSDTPSLADDSSEIGLNGIEPNQVSASTTFDFNNSDHHVHSDDGSNDADQSSVSSMNLVHRRSGNRKRKSDSSSVVTEKQEDPETTSTLSMSHAKKSRQSAADESQYYQQLLAQFLVRDKRHTLEEYKKEKLAAEEQRGLGKHPQPVTVKDLWVPVSAYMDKHNISKDRKEVRRDACTLCAMSVEEMRNQFGLTMDEARLLHGIFL